MFSIDMIRKDMNGVKAHKLFDELRNKSYDVLFIYSDMINEP